MLPSFTWFLTCYNELSQSHLAVGFRFISDFLLFYQVCEVYCIRFMKIRSKCLDEDGVDLIVQVMSYHPQYLETFTRSQSFIMRGDGPLPFHYRHYIAIMVSPS